MRRRHALTLLLLIGSLAAAAPRLKDIPDDEETKALNRAYFIRVEFKAPPVQGDDFCKLMDKLKLVFLTKSRKILLLNSRDRLSKFEWDLIRSHPNVKSLIPLKEVSELPRDPRRKR